MASPPLIVLVCSDRHRNGKTLLARVLVDFLLLEGRDPFVLDLGFPEGALRDFFPGRTALIDFAHVSGQMKIFDTILAGPGRDYVIDLPAQQLGRFCEAMGDLKFHEAASAAGFNFAVIFIVDEAEESLRSAAAVEDILMPDLFVPAANRFVGSALPDGVEGPTLTMERIDPDLHAIITNRRFSFRSFLLGEESGVPMRLRPNLKTFLHTLIAGFREFEPALSLLKLRA
jgi:hypothetical protein